MLDEYKGVHTLYPVAYDIVDRFVEKYESTVPGDSAVMSVRRIVGDSGTDYGLGVYLDSTLLENVTDDERKQEVDEARKSIKSRFFLYHYPFRYQMNGFCTKIKHFLHTKVILVHSPQK